MVDHSMMPLGKKAAIHDPRVPKMAAYMTAISFPPNYDEAGGITNWGVMLNDKLGCCTIAGVGHKVQADTKIVRTEFSATDDSILAMYEKWDGYDPANPATDQGGVESVVLAKWFAEGFYGHHVVAYGSVNAKDHDEVRHVLAAVNGLYIGVALPISAQTQKVWDVDREFHVFGLGKDPEYQPGSWGGHCVYVYGYTSDANGNLATLKFVSWGKEMEMTAAFWDTYVDEAWAVLLGAWIKGGRTPAGIDVAALSAEVEKLRAA